MRMLRLISALALAGALLPACSVLFDGSRFTNGGGGGDAGPGDDGGGPDEDAGPTDCDPGCGIDERCVDGTCESCDVDEDGYVVDDPACDPLGDPPDCDDADPDRHPFAVPVCGDGIDQSCGSTLPGLPTSEVGFYALQEVHPPSVGAGSGPLARVRVAAQNLDSALAYFQLGDSRRTVMIGRAPMMTTTLPPSDAESIDMYVGGMGGAVTMRYDVQRDETDQIHLIVLVEDPTLGGAPGWIRASDTLFRPDGGWSNVGGQGFDPQGSGFGNFHLTGEPAVIARGGQFYIGVPAEFLQSGAPRRALFLLDMGAGTTDIAGGTISTATGAPVWSASDGRAAAFPGNAGSYVLWNGSYDPFAESEALQLVPGSMPAGRGAAYRASRGGTFSVEVLHPTASGVSLFQLPCDPAQPFASCPVDTSPINFPLDHGGGDPLLVAFEGGGMEPGVNFAYVDRTAGIEDVMFGYYAPGSGDLVTLPLPTEGQGSITDLDIDGTFVATDPMRGRALLAYAYARQNDSGDPTVYVGGVSACVGYEGP